MTFQYPKSIPLANLPTPITKLERLSEKWGGPEIYAKRDDLTGCALSGNKIRKLEFSVAEAIDLGSDILITCGGIQSNHARATAVTATRVGMESFLVLRGDPPSEFEGNLFLNRLVDAQFQFITKEAYEDVDTIMAEVAEALRKQGKRPYIIPEGASNEIGYFGYIRAAEEISQQLKMMNLKIDTIVLPTGSGGTLGGLLLGQRFFELKAQPRGINVCDTAPYFQDRIHDVILKMISKYGWDLTISKEEITLIDGYVGEGYALSRPEELELIAEVARMEGLILDPVYTGKAMFGLRDQIRHGRFKKGEKILFLHTGGMFGLFINNKLFNDIWRKT